MTAPPDAGTEATAVASSLALAEALLAEAERRRGRRERSQAVRLSRILANADSRALILALTDEVLRIHEPARAAAVLAGLARSSPGVAALGPMDRLAVRWGARLAPHLPRLVIPSCGPGSGPRWPVSSCPPVGSAWPATPPGAEGRGCDSMSPSWAKPSSVRPRPSAGWPG